MSVPSSRINTVTSFACGPEVASAPVEKPVSTDQKQYVYEVAIVGRDLPELFEAASLSVGADAVICCDADGAIVFFAPTAANVSYARRLDEPGVTEAIKDMGGVPAAPDPVAFTAALSSHGGATPL